MSFGEAVRSVLGQYATFGGRARRSEYWWFWLFTALGNLVLAGVEDALDLSHSPLTGLWGLVLVVPTLAVGARRLHDVGRSGWWLLLVVVPVIGWIVLIVWFCRDSQPANGYGPSPKVASA